MYKLGHDMIMFCMASVFRTGCSLVWKLDALVVMCPPEVQLCYRAAHSNLPEDLLGMRIVCHDHN